MIFGVEDYVVCRLWISLVWPSQMPAPCRNFGIIQTLQDRGSQLSDGQQTRSWKLFLIINSVYNSANSSVCIYRVHHHGRGGMELDEGARFRFNPGFMFQSLQTFEFV